ncbi:MAG: VOC family protein [Rhodospirillales bacterium]
MLDQPPTGTQYARPTEDGKFIVGGMKLDRPFRIRRLGHFGFNVYNYDDAVRFYTDLLGFDISDARSYEFRLNPEQIARLQATGGSSWGCFTRYGTDHHAFVLFSRHLREVADPPGRWRPGVTVNQVTWQVGSLGEVGDAARWLTATGQAMLRTGRDMPGSNWHTYFSDPDGHPMELYWGMEQIGWNGHSKPRNMYSRAFQAAPPLPQMAEFDEVEEALRGGTQVTDGFRHTQRPPARYDVQGQMLPRPFKIVRIGPVRLFVADMAAALKFYTETMGFTLTETIDYRGHTCAFLRTAGEHHVLALYPLALRALLGLPDNTTCLNFGLQLANYQQLRDARDFLAANGVRFAELPPELFPGVDYAFDAVDPDGHRVQLYHAIEQVGFDGRPRQGAARRTPAPPPWPLAIDYEPDSFIGEPYLGPWG